MCVLQLERAQKLLNRRGKKEVVDEQQGSGKEDGEQAEPDIGPKANVSLLDQHSELKKMAESKCQSYPTP